MNKKPYWKKFFICKRILVQISAVLCLFFGCQVDEGYNFVISNNTEYQITISIHRLEGHVQRYTIAPKSTIRTYDYQITNAPYQKAVVVFDDQKMSVHINHRDEERDCSMYNSLYCFDSCKISEKLKLVAYEIRERDYQEAIEIERD